MWKKTRPSLTQQMGQNKKLDQFFDIEPKKKVKLDTFNPTINQKQVSHNLQSLNTVQQNFALSLQNPVSSSTGVLTTLWTYTIPAIGTNQKNLILDFGSGVITFLNYTASDFPPSIGVYIAQLDGYLDNAGQPTHRVATYYLSQMNSLVLSGVQTWNLVYKLCQPAVWQIGTQRQLTMSVGDQTSGLYNGPLQNPVNIHMKILHVSY